MHFKGVVVAHLDIGPRNFISKVHVMDDMLYEAVIGRDVMVHLGPFLIDMAEKLFYLPDPALYKQSLVNVSGSVPMYTMQNSSAARTDCNTVSGNVVKDVPNIRLGAARTVGSAARTDESIFESEKENFNVNVVSSGPCAPYVSSGTCATCVSSGTCAPCASSGPCAPSRSSGPCAPSRPSGPCAPVPTGVGDKDESGGVPCVVKPETSGNASSRANADEFPRIGITVYVKQDILIQPKCGWLMEVHHTSMAPTDGDVLFTATEGYEGLITPKFIQTVRPGQTFQIFVVNISDQVINIPCSTTLYVGEYIDVASATLVKPRLGQRGTHSVPMCSMDPVTPLVTRDSFVEQFGIGQKEHTSVELTQLQDLLWEYQDIFGKHDYDVGHNSEIKLSIDTGDSAPICCKRRIPVAFSHRETVGKIIDSMESEGIIRRSWSPWAMPLLVVRKKDGSVRLVIDYRPLNKVLKKDSYPLPKIEELLASLNGHKYFTTLDLNSGFYNIEVEESSKEKTAFTCFKGLYEFNRMPMGLSNSPALMQRLANLLLSEIGSNIALAYIDDIIVMSEDFKSHLSDLRVTFAALRKKGVKIKAKKVRIAKRKVLFLGFEVDARGIRVDPNRFEVIENLASPRNVKEVQQVHGFLSYYRKFIPNFSKIAAPITRLLRKDSEFRWSDQCISAFRTLKDVLLKDQVLYFPDLNKAYQLEIDASALGFGAILSQEKNGVMRPIAFASKRANKYEHVYGSTELEACGLVFACKRFRSFITGRPVTVLTDHRGLITFLTATSASQRVQRWACTLQEFFLSIVYRPGRIHSNVDMLSRLGTVNSEVPKIEGILCSEQSFADLKQNFPEEHFDSPREASRIFCDIKNVQPCIVNSVKIDSSLEDEQFSLCMFWEPDDASIDEQVETARLVGTADSEQEIARNKSIAQETALNKSVDKNIMSGLVGASFCGPPGTARTDVKTVNACAGVRSILKPNRAQRGSSKRVQFVLPNEPMCAISFSSAMSRKRKCVVKTIGVPSKRTRVTRRKKSPVVNMCCFYGVPSTSYNIMDMDINESLPNSGGSSPSSDVHAVDFNGSVPDSDNCIGLMVSVTNLRAMQELDPLLGPIRRFIRSKVIPDDLVAREGVRKHASNCVIEEGILYYRVQNVLRVFVPSELRGEILAANHSDFTAGHLGQFITQNRIRQRYFWPQMKADIDNYISCCETCQTRKGPNRPNRPELQPLSIVGPCERLVIDTVGPFKPSLAGNKHIIVVTDWLTKHVEIFALRDITAETIARVLVDEIITRYGAPKEILSDRGSAFSSKLVKALCLQCHISKVYSTPYAPQTQGLVERFNRTLLGMISACVGASRSWDQILPFLRLAYNSTVQSTTKASPFLLTFGREARLPLDVALETLPSRYDPENYLETLVANLNTAYNSAYRNIEAAQEV